MNFVRFPLKMKSNISFTPVEYNKMKANFFLNLFSAFSKCDCNVFEFPQLGTNNIASTAELLSFNFSERRDGPTLTRFVEKGCLEGVMLSLNRCFEAAGIESVPYRLFTSSNIANRAKNQEEGKRRRRSKRWCL